MKPRILLHGRGAKVPFYIEAVEHSGGIPVHKFLDDLSANYDGLLLCGGGDIDPSRYGQNNNASVGIDLARDAAELALIEAFVTAGKPILGICRGIQILNVYFGGTINQHIATAEAHQHQPDAVHVLTSLGESALSKLYGPRFPVNSNHHQAIGKLGNGLTVTQVCEADGVIEAIAHESLPIIGLQWHPERMCLSRQREDTVNGIEILRYFVNLCT